MIVPLIAKTIADTPMTSNKILWQILEPYGKPYCFTDGIIHGVRTEARRLIFGDADENVRYAYFVKEKRSYKRLVIKSSCHLLHARKP